MASALAIVFNGCLFALGALAGQLMLAKHYRELVAINPRHRFGRAAWVALYVFVAVQMAWILRPFVGVPGLSTRFLREDAWSNAYVQVLTILWRFVTGR